jgi:hypothetical protein
MILFSSLLRRNVNAWTFVDNDNEMRKQFSHLSSQKRGDLAILSASNFLIFDSVSRQPRSQPIAEIKLVSLVNSQGSWTPAGLPVAAIKTKSRTEG